MPPLDKGKSNMIKVIWHTNKVVTPDNQISTTRNNTTGETYPAEVMTQNQRFGCFIRKQLR